jgi:hypothetical protein
VQCDRVEASVLVQELRAGSDRDCRDETIRKPTYRRSPAATGSIQAGGGLVIERLLERQELAATQQTIEVSGLALVASACEDLEHHDSRGRQLLVGFDSRPEATVGWTACDVVWTQMAVA